MTYTAYIRIKNKWCRIGQYGTKCHGFVPDAILNKPKTLKAEYDIKPDDALTDEIRFFKNMSRSLPRIPVISDVELAQLCRILEKSNL